LDASWSDRPLETKTRIFQATLGGLVRGFIAVSFMSFGCSDFALGEDADGSAKTTALPNIYLDLRTTYATVPANTLSIGLGDTSVFTTLSNIARFIRPTTLPTAPTLSSPASQNVALDVPLTVDVSDRISLYGGFTGSATHTDISSWSTLAISSWFVGFQADVYQQNGGSIPTVTLQSTITRSVPDSPLATTTLNTIAEFSYALNEDETKGLLAGVQYTRIDVDSPLATINGNVVGYVGGYYQWPDNWKFTGRAGVQSFGGARLLNLTPFQPFTQPVLRLDIDRMDDNDNRLFGVTLQIAWVPKPSYQLTLRTPLYAVRN
jgi:hypothetical protein